MNVSPFRAAAFLISLGLLSIVPPALADDAQTPF